MIGPLSYLDLTLLTLGLISALLAMYRGFVREMLSIVSWIVAAVAAYVAFRQAQVSIGPEIGKQLGLAGNNASLVGAAAIALAAFLVVLIIVHLITSKISDLVLDSNVGMVDRLLGFAFGFVRGALIVVVLFMLANEFVPDQVRAQPWVAQSVTLPYIQGPGNWLKGVLTQYAVPLLEKKGSDQPG
jgi:membrane protein required for colicin V production